MTAEQQATVYIYKHLEYRRLSTNYNLYLQIIIIVIITIEKVRLADFGFIE